MKILQVEKKYTYSSFCGKVSMSAVIRSLAAVSSATRAGLAASGPPVLQNMQDIIM